MVDLSLLPENKKQSPTPKKKSHVFEFSVGALIAVIAILIVYGATRQEDSSIFLPAGRVPQANLTESAIGPEGSSSENINRTDSDLDGLTDKEEEALGTDPRNPDTDGDTYNDGEEVANGYNPNEPAKEPQKITKDSDNDGLSDAEEAQIGTDPHNKDTDGDGYSDGLEVDTGNDPRN